MCLYGNDLDEDTTPVEAGLTWVIGMSRSPRSYPCLSLVAKARTGENLEILSVQKVFVSTSKTALRDGVSA